MCVCVCVCVCVCRCVCRCVSSFVCVVMYCIVIWRVDCHSSKSKNRILKLLHSAYIKSHYQCHAFSGTLCAYDSVGLWVCEYVNVWVCMCVKVYVRICGWVCGSAVGWRVWRFAGLSDLWDIWVCNGLLVCCSVCVYRCVHMFVWRPVSISVSQSVLLGRSLMIGWRKKSWNTERVPTVVTLCVRVCAAYMSHLLA